MSSYTEIKAAKSVTAQRVRSTLKGEIKDHNKTQRAVFQQTQTEYPVD